MPSNIKKECPICKKEFIPHHSWQVYCSKKCGAALKRKGEILKCAICGKEFYRKRKEIKRGKSLCCSKECRGKWWSKVLTERLKGIPARWYSQGRSYEYKAIQELKEKEGCFLAVRSPGSKGMFDIFGLKIDEKDVYLYLIQVKALKRTSTVNRALPKQERAILLKSVKDNIFPFWRGKKEITNKGKPAWATKLFIELWIWEKRVGWHKFRLDFNNFNWLKV